MNQPNDPTNPDPTTAAWEEAMSRDFDARVRDLHEAPLDISSVKGKAHKIRRNRRAAVAGSVLGVAAVITPFALLANGDNDAGKEPEFAPEAPTTSAVDPAEPDYILDGKWHQADGDEIKLPDTDQPYQSALIWEGQLVATRWDGEVYNVTDVFDESGTAVDSFATAGPVVANESATVIAWVGADGKVMTRSGGGEVELGTVGMAAPGETVAWTAAAVTGGPDCNDNDELPACVVYLNSGLGEESRRLDSLGIDEAVASGVTKVFDATDDGVVSVINEVTDDLNTCGGLLDLIDGTLRWTTCDHQVQLVSPDGGLVAAPQSQYDGLGPTQLSILDARSGQMTGTYGAEGGFVGTWAWTTDHQLLFTAHDGAQWHLISMGSDGTITEIVDPVAGTDVDSPFLLIQH